MIRHCKAGTDLQILGNEVDVIDILYRVGILRNLSIQSDREPTWMPCSSRLE